MTKGGSSGYQAREHTDLLPATSTCQTSRFRCCQNRRYAQDCHRHFVIYRTRAGDGTYTKSVDIWSLGIVTVELLYGLPYLRMKKGVRWWQCVVAYVSERDADNLRDFLLDNMLRREPSERLSATQCLAKMAQVQLFADHSQTGSRTPRLSSTCRPEELTTVRISSGKYKARLAAEHEAASLTRSLKRKEHDTRSSADRRTRPKARNS